MEISFLLEEWYHRLKRDLPWRQTTSPYRIWLSEIILQQTRVNQGLEYYLTFVARYPEVEDLANAPLDEVLKLWQGLGYYTRARNLHATAQYVARELKGVFPSSFEGLLKLKGIGNYTAAAIASIAFHEAVAVVDGNVYRVLSRFFGESRPVNSSAGARVFDVLANRILNRKQPGIHNQAMMELGALVCLPANPVCNACPLAALCVAFQTGKTDRFPVKIAKKYARQRYFNYLFIVHDSLTWISQRKGKDIWHSLYEFPLIETPGPVQTSDLVLTADWKRIAGDSKYTMNDKGRTYRHQLTHQTIFCNFIYLLADSVDAVPASGYTTVKLTELHLYAVPRLIDRYLNDLKQEGLL